MHCLLTDTVPRIAIMVDFDLLVLNGLVVTDQESGALDIAIKDGKIAKVVPRGSLDGAKAKRSIDALGGMVMVRT